VGCDVNIDFEALLKDYKNAFKQDPQGDQNRCQRLARYHLNEVLRDHLIQFNVDDIIHEALCLIILMDSIIKHYNKLDSGKCTDDQSPEISLKNAPAKTGIAALKELSEGRVLFKNTNKDIQIRIIGHLRAVGTFIKSLYLYKQGSIEDAWYYYSIGSSQVASQKALDKGKTEEDEQYLALALQVIQGGSQGGKTAAENRVFTRTQIKKAIKNKIQKQFIWNDANQTLQSITAMIWAEIKSAIDNGNNWQGISHENLVNDHRLKPVASSYGLKPDLSAIRPIGYTTSKLSSGSGGF